MSLSVCLLTRNEEHNLGRALRSVAGLADQVVVADTGSNDRTIAIARELGAQVYHQVWQDDFGAARSFALDQARGDWILWLNPDEELLESSHALVRECLAQDRVFAFSVLVAELVRDNPPVYYTETAQTRLFRRHAQLHSVGRTHPNFVPPLEDLARQENQTVGVSQIRLRRHAYTSKLTEEKLRWVARLLELELRDRPGRLFYLIEYGRTLLLLNDARGHEIFAQAIEQILERRDAAQPPAREAQKALEYALSVSPEQSRSKLTRAEAEELALRWFPSSPPLLWRIAEHYFKAGDFKKTAGHLERLIELGKTGTYDRSESFDPSILGDPTIYNLGACYTRLRQFDKAEPYFLSLLSSPTHRQLAIQGLTTIQSLREQSARG
jgi:hypothetical protein